MMIAIQHSTKHRSRIFLSHAKNLLVLLQTDVTQILADTELADQLAHLTCVTAKWGLLEQTVINNYQVSKFLAKSDTLLGHLSVFCCLFLWF